MLPLPIYIFFSAVSFLKLITYLALASMAFQTLVVALLFALALANVEVSKCQVFKGSVTCLDCNTHFDLSDIKVLVKCSQVKKLALATTAEDGTFETELPSDSQTTPNPSPACAARILGGPAQLYTTRKTMVSKTIKVHAADSYYTLSTPLEFFKLCPLAKDDTKCGAQNAEFGSSETVDLPLPREWGLAPTSYYVPFVPIIGIP